MADSIFTQIIKGEVPANKIYEDDLTLAFLNIYPDRPGHTLVIPKKQVDHLWDLPDEDYQAVMSTAKKVAQRMRQVLKPERVGVKVIGEEVPHAHVHLIPFNNAREFHETSPHLGVPDYDALEAMAKRLAF